MPVLLTSAVNIFFKCRIQLTIWCFYWNVTILLHSHFFSQVWGYIFTEVSQSIYESAVRGGNKCFE